MLDLDKVTLRWGHNARFLNVHYDGSEIGALKFDANGEVERIEASRGGPMVQSSNCLPDAPESSGRAYGVDDGGGLWAQRLVGVGRRFNPQGRAVCAA